MLNDQWIRIIADYDPELHGTSRQYCQSLEVNLKTYYSRKIEYNRSTGIPSRKITKWDEVLLSFDPEKETLKDFCRRNHFNYEAAKSARHRRKFSKPRIKREKIFTNENGFFELGGNRR